MNPRIQELANEAAKFSAIMALPTGESGDKLFVEKFAELIVQECATAITDDELAKDCGTFLMDSWAKGMRYSAHLIKEHFGVEE